MEQFYAHTGLLPGPLPCTCLPALLTPVHAYAVHTHTLIHCTHILLYTHTPHPLCTPTLAHPHSLPIAHTYLCMLAPLTPVHTYPCTPAPLFVIHTLLMHTHTTHPCAYLPIHAHTPHCCTQVYPCTPILLTPVHSHPHPCIHIYPCTPTSLTSHPTHTATHAHPHCSPLCTPTCACLHPLGPQFLWGLWTTSGHPVSLVVTGRGWGLRLCSLISGIWTRFCGPSQQGSGVGGF